MGVQNVFFEKYCRYLPTSRTNLLANSVIGMTSVKIQLSSNGREKMKMHYTGTKKLITKTYRRQSQTPSAAVKILGRSTLRSANHLEFRWFQMMAMQQFIKLCAVSIGQSCSLRDITASKLE